MIRTLRTRITGAGRFSSGPEMLVIVSAAATVAFVVGRGLREVI